MRPAILQFSRLSLARTGCALLAVPLMTIPLTTGAGANGTKSQRVKTEIVFIWSKLPVWRLNIDAQLSRTGDRPNAPGSYRVTTLSRAVGVVWVATRATSRSTVTGRVVRGRLQPERYISDGKFRGNKRRIVLTYDRGRTRLELSPPNANRDWTPVPPALRQGAPDPMTAVAATLRAGTERPCAWTREVYDGRRRYRVTLSYEGEDELKRSIWNRYSGKAIRCRVRSKTIAGHFKKYLNEKRPPQPASYIWFARFQKAGLWLPVKLLSKTRWGDVRGELFNYEIKAE